MRRVWRGLTQVTRDENIVVMRQMLVVVVPVITPAGE